MHDVCANAAPRHTATGERGFCVVGEWVVGEWVRVGGSVVEGRESSCGVCTVVCERKGHCGIYLLLLLLLFLFLFF